MTAPRPQFVYAATVLEVIDGDTASFEIDRGFHDYLHLTARFLGINAPEHNTEAGQKTITYLKGLLSPGQAVILQSHKITAKIRTDKYGGRWDAEVWLPQATMMSVNQMLVEAGLAQPWDGKGTKPT